jgi:DNA polymerase sigma
MNGYGPLDLAIRDILRVVQPAEGDWTIRFRIIRDIEAIVESIESLRGASATVEPYGSFVSNLFTKCGDLDISIELPNGSHISSPGKKYKLAILVDVQRALKRRGGCRKVQFIPNARVPILKIESKFHNISCDISINNLTSQMKSKILFWINEIDGRFRDMVLLVKEWAMAHNINNSKSGSLNSYALCLLVIFHFQTCEPAILPPMKEIYPGSMVHDLIGIRAAAEKNIEETCAVNINRFKLDPSRRKNYSSLSEIFVSFLAKFCDISERAAEQGISTYSGQWEDISSNMTWQPRTYSLLAEDPFEQPANCARTVNARQLSRIAEAFQTSHRVLTSPPTNQDPRSILPMLSRPQVCHPLLGIPLVRYPNVQQPHRPVHAPSNTQSRPPNRRPDKHPNAQRSVQAQQQQQRMWRPRSQT